MGRMLETLRQARERRGQPGAEAPALQAVWLGEDADGRPEGEAVPFIEVGGPAALGAPSPPEGLMQPLTPDPSPATGEGRKQNDPASRRGEEGDTCLPLRLLREDKGEDLSGPAAFNLPPQGKAPTGKVRPPRLLTVSFRAVPLMKAPGRGANFARELVAHHEPAHPISGQYRDLVAAVLAQMPGPRARVLLFTGAAAEAGTTTVTLNVAVTLARQGDRVAVLDAHLRRAAVAARLELSESPGLRDVLAGRVPLEAAVRETGVANLAVLTAGAADAASPARLVGETMRSALQQMREQFDLVLIDGPRWDGRPEVVALGCACDAVYLCLPEESQDTPECRDLLEIVPEQGAALRGCVLTGR